MWFDFFCGFSNFAVSYGSVLYGANLKLWSWGQFFCFDDFKLRCAVSNNNFGPKLHKRDIKLLCGYGIFINFTTKNAKYEMHGFKSKKLSHLINKNYSHNLAKGSSFLKLMPRPAVCEIETRRRNYVSAWISIQKAFSF